MIVAQEQSPELKALLAHWMSGAVTEYSADMVRPSAYWRVTVWTHDGLTSALRATRDEAITAALRGAGLEVRG